MASKKESQVMRKKNYLFLLLFHYIILIPIWRFFLLYKISVSKSHDKNFLVIIIIIVELYIAYSVPWILRHCCRNFQVFIFRMYIFRARCWELTKLFCVRFSDYKFFFTFAFMNKVDSFFIQLCDYH